MSYCRDQAAPVGMCGTILWARKKWDLTFRSNTLSHPRSSVACRDKAETHTCACARHVMYPTLTSRMGPATGLHATLDTKTSIRPYAFTTSFTSSVRASVVPTWQGMARTFLIPLARSCARAASTFFRLREQMAILAPSRPRRSAMA